LVWQTQDREIDWFRLVEGQYLKMTPNENGRLRSQVFPGLDLDVAAALKCDKARLIAGLQGGEV
jgi:hypothetical protein